MKFTYDKEYDMFYIYRLSTDKKSKDNIGDENIVIDLDENNEIIGVELIDATQVLQKHSGKSYEEIKDMLGNLTKCTLDLEFKDDKIYIKIIFVSNSNQLSSTLAINDDRALTIA